MQKICWIGNDYFGTALRSCGVEQLHVMAAPAGLPLSWRDICEAANFEPDMVVVADSGTGPFVLGVEEFPALTLFFSVSPHLHSWHGLYAQAFDACAVAQADYVQRFTKPFLGERRVWFLPPFAHTVSGDAEALRFAEPIFVSEGFISPRRKKFLRELGEAIPQLVGKTGDPAKLLTTHSIVLHLGTERPGLDFRIFEAMAAGACVVLPKVGNGLDQLFVDGEHFVGFTQGNVADAIYSLNFLLENSELTQYVASTGQAEVAAKHLAEHRIWEFMDHIYELAAEDLDEVVNRRRRNAFRIRNHSLKVPYLVCSRKTEDDNVRRAFEMAAAGSFGLDGWAASDSVSGSEGGVA